MRSSAFEPMTKPWILRPIRPADDEAIAAIIRTVMTEHGCTGEGFAIHDAEVACMSRHYAGPEARYFVVTHDGTVVGGAGFARLLGTTAETATCELRKMYFLERARGLGLGHALLDLLLDEMRAAGYRRCYLETTSWMKTAQHLYQQHGFAEVPGPEGCTGHGGCDTFYAQVL